MKDPSSTRTSGGGARGGGNNGNGDDGHGRMMLILMNVRTPGGTTPHGQPSAGGTDGQQDSATDATAATAAAITPEKEGRDGDGEDDDGGGGSPQTPAGVGIGDDGAEETTESEPAATGGVSIPPSPTTDGGTSTSANAVATSALDLLFPPHPSSRGGEEGGEDGCTTSGLPTSRPCVVSLPDPAAAGGDDAHPRRHYVYVPRGDERVDGNGNNGNGDDPSGCTGFMGDVYEMQHLQNPTSPTGPGGTPKSYGSFLVDSLVVSDGRFTLVSRVDPLFFALSVLGGDNGEGKKYRWMPLDQIVAELPSPVRMALADDRRRPSPTPSDGDTSSPPPPTATTYSQLDNILESTDQLGDDFLLYRFSPDGATRWLVEKHRRAVGAMRSRLVRRRGEERRRLGGGDAGGGGVSGGNGGAFSDAFTLPEDGDGDDGDGDDVTNTDTGPDATDATVESPDKIGEGGATTTTTTPAPAALDDDEEERAAAVGALQLVCGYLPPSGRWHDALAVAVGLSPTDVVAASSDGKKKRKDPSNSSQAGQKRKADKWGNGGDDGEADKLLQYTLGVDGNGGGAGDAATLIGDDGDGAKTKKQKAQSFGLKKLAKVNTKGMKSLSSFFGGGGGGGGGGGSKKKKQKVVTPCVKKNEP